MGSSSVMCWSAAVSSSIGDTKPPSREPQEQIRRCKDTGCTKIHFGVESANNEGLDVWGKHCDTDDVHRVFRWCRKERAIRRLHHACRTTRANHGRGPEQSRRNAQTRCRICCFRGIFPLSRNGFLCRWSQKGLYPADCWDRLMKILLWCGSSRMLGRKTYPKPKFLISSKSPIENSTCVHRLLHDKSLVCRVWQSLKRLTKGGLSLLLSLLKSSSRTAPVWSVLLADLPCSVSARTYRE